MCKIKKELIINPPMLIKSIIKAGGRRLIVVFLLLVKTIEILYIWLTVKLLWTRRILR
jgi:hypothetical protein